MSRVDTVVYEFGPFRLSGSERMPLKQGKPISVAPKIFDTLVVLVENSGRLIDKDEMMSRVWPDTFVEEATPARNISDLRRLLGDSLCRLEVDH